MDFGSWSPSHTILALFVVAGFVGQVAVYFYKTSQNTKRIERLEERMDKRFAELISIMNHQIADLRSEMNQQMSDVRGEIRDLRLEMSKLNQNHIDHLTHHHDN